MTTNPYAIQAALMTGDSPTQVMKDSKRAPITLEYAQAQGFATVAEYLEALHEFLNGNWWTAFSRLTAASLSSVLHNSH